MAYTLDLTGKVALITGATRGLGYAMTMAFADAGADIIVSSRKAEACEKVAQEVRALGRRALAAPCHVGYWDQIEALVGAAYAEFGRVDVLVNNAGLSPTAPSSVEVTEALFDKIVDINFKGPFRLCALVGSRMAAGDGGSIINVSSLGALAPRSFFLPYAGAKAALNTLAAGFVDEFSPKVRINTLSPGQFATDIAEAWGDAKPTQPLGRYGEPHEIVGAALYLASDASSYTTGANIGVGGGLRAS